MAKPGKIEGLECDINAAEAIQLVLAGRFKEMASFSDAALVLDDPEGVHDMRVASRRLRSALKDFLPFMRKRPLADCEAKIKKIANALGAVRDEDVLIGVLEKLMSSCPADVVAGIEALILERKERRARACNLLEKTIDKGQLEVLRTHFQRTVEKAVKTKRGKGSEDRYAKDFDFKEIGVKIISDRISELNSRRPLMFEPFRRKRLHRLRITAKYLRYSLQLFAECLSESLNGIVDPVTNLQRALGDLHDADVFIQELGSDLANTALHSPATADFRPEHGSEVWLLSEYIRSRSSYYREALDEWERLQPRLIISATKTDG